MPCDVRDALWEHKGKPQAVVYDPSCSHALSTMHFHDDTEEAVLGFGFKPWGTPVWIPQAA